MKRMNQIWMALAAAAALLGLGVETRPVHAQELSELRVKVRYEGGQVDQQHGIHLFVFDSPDFVSGAGNVIPIAMRTVHDIDEAVVLSGLRHQTLYLAAAYNESGDYEYPMGPPPSGTPVAVYRMDDPASPTPIQLKSGAAVEIEFSFDDSNRMP